MKIELYLIMDLDFQKLELVDNKLLHIFFQILLVFQNILKQWSLLIKIYNLLVNKQSKREEFEKLITQLKGDK